MASGQTVRLAGASQRNFAKRLIDAAPVDAVVNVREATRTTAQSDKMWAMLSDVARAKPNGRNHTTEQWKAIFMASCGHKPQFLPDLENDSFICMGYRSSRLNKHAMSDLIESIYEFGARHDVKWSGPQE